MEDFDAFGTDGGGAGGGGGYQGGGVGPYGSERDERMRLANVEWAPLSWTERPGLATALAAAGLVLWAVSTATVSILLAYFVNYRNEDGVGEGPWMVTIIGVALTLIGLLVSLVLIIELFFRGGRLNQTMNQIWSSQSRGGIMGALGRGGGGGGFQRTNMNNGFNDSAGGGDDIF